MGMIENEKYMRLKIITNILLLLWLFTCPCNAGEVVLLDVSNEPSVAKSQLKLACQFLGVNVKHFTLEDGNNSSKLVNSINGNGVQAVVIAQKVLAEVDPQTLLPALLREDGKVALLLIMGLTRETDANLLCSWSNGGIMGCTGSKVVPFEGLYEVSDLKVLTGQLAGQQIPFNAEKLNYLVLDKRRNARSIIQVENDTNESVFPVFVKTVVDGQEVFFQTHIEFSTPSGELSKRDDRWMGNVASCTSVIHFTLMIS